MNLQQFLAILLAQKKVALITLSASILATLVVSMLLPKTYKATTTLIVNYKATDPVSGMTLPAQLMPGYMATQTDIITSRKVALKVVDNLGLARSPSAVEEFNKQSQGEGDVRDWLAESLSKKLDVEPSHESSVIKIGYEGNDPKFVAALANAFADAYIQTTLQLRIEPSQRAAEWFGEQIKTLRDNLTAAQDKLSAYQREKGIVSVDQHMDVENARLAELSSQLVAAQVHSYDASSRQGSIDGDNRLDANPDIMNNPLIQRMKADLYLAEGKLAEISQRLSHNHPQYQAAQAEVDDRRLKLESELRNTRNSLNSAANISQQREASIRSALAAQKARVLEISRQRDELSILQRDVANAQKVLDMAMQRFSQTNLEGQANQSEVAVLNPAIPPSDPSKPRIYLNLLLSVFFGTILAVGLALLFEFRNRRVRAPEDITMSLELPLLAVIGAVKLKRKIWPWRFVRNRLMPAIGKK